MSVLGIDLGGTKIAAGRVTDGAEIDGAMTLASRAAEGFEISIAQLWSAIERTLDASVEAIGVAAPGPLDPIGGVILTPPHLKGWRNVPLAQMTQEKFGLPVRIENDCTAAALGEARVGAGRGHSIVYYVAIGTGVGSGIVRNGEIYTGAHGCAG
ncbi:MAG TPA: ROK family protein, partial [Bryobacteraceae bacterium]|nr:ROK family protein [Bryobacteraceae bacterium]